MVEKPEIHYPKRKTSIFKTVRYWFTLNTVMAVMFASLWIIMRQEYSVELYVKNTIVFFVIFQVISGLCALTGYLNFYYLRERPFFQILMSGIVVALASASIGIVLLYLIAGTVNLFYQLNMPPGGLMGFAIGIGPTSYLITLILTIVFTRIDFLEYHRKKARMNTLAEISATKSEKPMEPIRKITMDAPGLVIREDENHFIIDFNEIFYCSAHGKKTVVHTIRKEYLTTQLLKDLEKKLPESLFFRVHKSYIMNLRKVSHLQYYLGGSYLAFLKDEENTTIPVSRTNAAALKERMGMKN